MIEDTDAEEVTAKRKAAGEGTTKGMRFRAFDNFSQIAAANDPKDQVVHRRSFIIRPGRHHFFFVKKGKKFMLSD